MASFIGRRLIMIVPILFVDSIVVFLLTSLSPGSAARQLAGGADASPEAIAIATKQLGLDKPLLDQYWSWLAGAVHGHLGQSFFQPESVQSIILARLPVTLSIAIGSMIVGVAIALVAGLLAAAKPDGKIDRCVTIAASFGIATPDFFIALLLVLVFAVKFKVFPAIGYVPLTQNPGLWFTHLVLPWLALAGAVAAPVARHLRAAMRDVMAQPYIVTSVAMGMRRQAILLKYALKNASMPVVTVLGLQFSRLLGGTVVIETVFAMYGVGNLAVTSVLNKDYPVIQGIAMTTVVLVIVVNLLVDLSYMFLNPRVRVS
jgi:peptide/nickel transport system permease protein